MRVSVGRTGHSGPSPLEGRPDLPARVERRELGLVRGEDTERFGSGQRLLEDADVVEVRKSTVDTLAESRQ